MKKITFLKTACSIALALTMTTKTQAQTPIAYYTFDNTIDDHMGNWNLSQSADFAGTLTYVTGKDGTPNGAVTGFTGPDYLETATDFSITANDSRTMTAWIKVDQFSNGGLAVIGLGEKTNNNKWTFGTQGTKARVEIQGSGYNATTFGDLVLDTWYHIAVTYNNSDNLVSLYVNGSLSDTRTWANLNTTTTPLRVGNDFNNLTPPQTRGFQGAIDDVRIFNSALTSSEIQAIYNIPSLSNDNIEIETFKAFPNPVTSTLNFTTSEIKSVDVYSIVGGKISTLETSNNSVDFSNFSNGMYILSCKDDNGAVLKTIKVVKK